MPRCVACCKNVRRLHGDYGLCAKCHEHLEADIASWSASLDCDLDRIVRFDAYCAERDASRD